MKHTAINIAQSYVNNSDTSMSCVGCNGRRGLQSPVMCVQIGAVQGAAQFLCQLSKGVSGVAGDVLGSQVCALVTQVLSPVCCEVVKERVSVCAGGALATGSSAGVWHAAHAVVQAHVCADVQVRACKCAPPLPPSPSETTAARCCTFAIIECELHMPQARALVQLRNHSWPTCRHIGRMNVHPCACALLSWHIIVILPRASVRCAACTRCLA